MVTVEVWDGKDSWIKANCFLDGGSNETMVRKGFVCPLPLKELGSFTAKFATTGGKIHTEPARDYSFCI